jgi:hypothetical protein
MRRLLWERTFTLSLTLTITLCAGLDPPHICLSIGQPPPTKTASELSANSARPEVLPGRRPPQLTCVGQE